MKQFLLISTFLASTFSIFAQLPAALDRLDGRWISGNVISEWQFIDDYSLNNRTFQVIQNDTTEISRSYVRSDNKGETTLTYVSPAGENHQFRLITAEICRLIWRNVQPGAEPSCVTIERAGLNQYKWIGIGEAMAFKHEKEGRLKTKFGISIDVNKKIIERLGGETSYRRSEADVTGSAVSLQISHTKSIFGLNLEAGYRWATRPSERYISTATSSLLFQGREFHYAPYIAVLPTCRFGKKERIVLSTGLMASFNVKNKLTGNLYTTGKPTTEDRDLLYYSTTGVLRHFNFMASLGYELPVKVSGIQPGIFVKMVSGSGVSVGMNMTFGAAGGR